MTDWWVQLRDWLEGRDLRERVLIFLAAVAVIGVGGYELLLAPAIEERDRLEQQTRGLQQEVQGLRAQIEDLSGRSFDQEKARLRARRKELQQQLRAQQEALGERAGAFIRPKRLMAFFEDLLLTPGSGPMRVVRVESQDREPLEVGASAAEEGRAPELYRKGVVVGLRGTYPELLDLLDAVEALDWAVQVTGLDYRVLEYPRAEVTVTLHTFLFEPEGAGDGP